MPLTFDAVVVAHEAAVSVGELSPDRSQGVEGQNSPFDLELCSTCLRPSRRVKRFLCETIFDAVKASGTAG